MRTVLLALAAVVVVLAVLFFTGFLNVEQTQEAELPDVDVTTEGGQAPEFEAETGEVEIGTETNTVEVPEVEVTTEETEIETPTIDVEPAEPVRAD
jgi:beta-lactam-binding protein with PASTA domain